MVNQNEKKYLYTIGVMSLALLMFIGFVGVRYGGSISASATNLWGSSCYDSDNGMNIKVKGYVANFNLDNVDKTEYDGFYYEDECLDPYTLKEAYCDKNNVPKFNITTCICNVDGGYCRF